MNILVFGKDGQLGKAFKTVFDVMPVSLKLNVKYIGRSDCDLSDEASLKKVLDSSEANFIINASAYTAVDKAEIEQALAFAVNARAPELMAQYAAEHGATFFHYSTDYVFDGRKTGFYLEDDQRNPLGIYGKSKAAGEIAIEKVFKGTQVRYAIFRTSWVYGDGGNFIRTILRLAKDREELKIIQDQYGVPTSTQWLAKTTLDLALDKDQLRDFYSGIYHAVPGGETTWHGLACLAVDVALKAGASLKVKPELIKPILAVKYPLPAPRPMNSRMNTDKLRKEIVRDADVSKLQQWSGSWEAGVEAYVQALVKDGLI
jgi:dTDP-4-dehydrorhamnose reductase